MLSLRGITEHETFDHPVAVLIVISSANPDPMSTIMQLYNPNVPSFTIDKPYVDPNILRFYVLLHDPQQTTLEQSQIVFDKMKKTFGLHCHLLKLNSRPPPSDLFEDSIQHMDENNAIRDIWSQLPTSLNIESRLQARTSTLAGPELLSPNSSSFSTPLSPSPSGHRRSNSASSNTNSFTAPTHGTNLQNGPLDMTSPLEDGTRMPTHDMHLIGSAASPAMQYGRCLTVDDVQNTQLMVKELVVQSLVPFMERNVQHWNEQVASARRGITGRVFGAGRRFFGTSSRTSSPQSIQSIPATGPNTPVGTNTLTIFPYAAPEAQMRKLADYAFMLRDFKFAHAIYDNVRRDYATEKAYKYHAGTQEMIGVCQLMLNQPLTNKLDVDRNFELAVQQYLGRCRSSFHATRTTIMYYELLKARRMWKEVPTALVRMTGEDSDLRSALFLEQAAHCFLRAPSPMVRKYGFHLVMAGHRYGKASQRQHAFRCYKLAAYIVEGQEWSVAKSHIQFALGRQAFHLGQLEDAVKYFTNVLADAKQMPQQQAAHIREFLFIYRQYTTQAGIDPLKESLPHLSLPVIDDNATHVTLSNTQSNTGDNQEEWSTMEIELLEESIAKGYIAGSKKALAIQQQDDQRPICAVGEPFLVHISLFNPLQVAITLSQLILGCKHRESLQHNTDASTESDNEPMIYGTQIEGTDMYAFDDFELEKVTEIYLEPLEKRMISLAIIPRREGSIAVKGLHYTFNDLVHTFKPFHKKGKRLHSTREQMMTPVYAVDHTLDIIVTSPMPLLDLAFHGIPETILSGELVQAVLEINNKGNKGMTALRLKSSHPSFICIGNPEEMDKHVYDSKTQTEEEIQFDNLLFDSSVISVPLPAEGGGQSNERGVVSPGKTTLVPLWIRGDRIGKHTFKFLFSYQSEEGNGAIAHRTLRYTVNLQVLPSLKINAFTRPSTTAVNEYILGIEIENLQVAANFQLNQISATSPVWTITPLSINTDSPQDIQAKTAIPPRQTTFAYYKIQKKTKQADQSLCPEAWTSSALEALLNNIEYREPPPSVDLHVSKLSFVSAYSWLSG
ncbi:ER-golgi trafficking TRAPP I complex 85 kDa subunit-domain-containing protein [Phycomyces nitens]|nr:ER-golgi trafficking TRAPP I complex 85 kDa subunit-domain-containing protein [Phycomyces nitens]